MIDIRLFIEYQDLMAQVTPKKLIECSRRAFFNADLPDRGPIGSSVNEVRVGMMIKLIIKELRKEV